MGVVRAKRRFFWYPWYPANSLQKKSFIANQWYTNGKRTHRRCAFGVLTHHISRTSKGRIPNLRNIVGSRHLFHPSYVEKIAEFNGTIIFQIQEKGNIARKLILEYKYCTTDLPANLSHIHATSEFSVCIPWLNCSTFSFHIIVSFRVQNGFLARKKIAC